MILSTYQPYFCPYPGFFHKALLSDIFVILDTVQFPRGTTWISRNRFKNDQGMHWLTVPVHKKGLGLQPIAQVRIFHEGRWREKHLTGLRHGYRHAPYFNEHIRFLEDLYSSRCEFLVDLNLEIIQYLMKALRIRTPVVRLSELNIHSRGTFVMLDICNKLHASVCLAQRSAARHLDTAMFEEAGIELRFFRPPALIYPQLWGNFIPNLSTFDLLFTCGPRAGGMLREGIDSQDLHA